MNSETNSPEAEAEQCHDTKTRTCPSCREENKPQAEYCAVCGKILSQSATQAFTRESEADRVGIIAEFWDFLKHNKKWWLQEVPEPPI